MGSIKIHLRRPIETRLEIPNPSKLRYFFTKIQKMAQFEKDIFLFMRKLFSPPARTKTAPIETFYLGVCVSWC